MALNESRVPDQTLTGPGSDVDEQTSEPVTVTVRVPQTASGSLLEAARDRINRATTACVEEIESETVDPRHGATRVTVTAEFTGLDSEDGTDSDSRGLIEQLIDAPCITVE